MSEQRLNSIIKCARNISHVSLLGIQKRKHKTSCFMFVSEYAVQYRLTCASTSWLTETNSFIIDVELNTALIGFFHYSLYSLLFNYDKIITKIYFKKMSSLAFLTLLGIGNDF